MAVIKVQKIPQKEVSIEETIMQFCYYYPQYTYQEARKLPYSRIIRMLKVARKEQALLLYNITEAAAAPHTKKGSGVKKLLSRFKDILSQ